MKSLLPSNNDLNVRRRIMNEMEIIICEREKLEG